MITKIVEGTNDQMCKVCKKINTDKFLLRYSDINEEEIKRLFVMLYFRGLYGDTKQPTKELWYDSLMSLNRYDWLMRAIIFHDHNTVTNDFLEDSFSRLRWFLT